MKNNKKNLAVVVALVALIWAYVGYQIYDAFTVEDITEVQPRTSRQLPIKLSEVNQPYTLFDINNNYRDPFKLNRKRSTEQTSSNRPAKPQKQLSTKAPAKPFKKPAIKFMGIVKSKQVGNRTGFFELNERAILRGQGDSVGNCLIFDLTADSAYLKFGTNQWAVGKP